MLFAVVKTVMTQPAALRTSFELLTSLVSDGPEQCVSIDNFAGLVELLDGYAAAAGPAVDISAHADHRKGASPHEATIERGRQAVEIVFDMRKFIARFTDCDPEQGEFQFY